MEEAEGEVGSEGVEGVLGEAVAGAEACAAGLTHGA